MEDKKPIGIVVLAVGAIVLIVSLLADPIGLGGSSGFGTYQIVGSIVGAIVAVAGYVLIRRL